jgi:hypothetical protein
LPGAGRETLLRNLYARATEARIQRSWSLPFTQRAQGKTPLR